MEEKKPRVIELNTRNIILGIGGVVVIIACAWGLGNMSGYNEGFNKAMKENGWQ